VFDVGFVEIESDKGHDSFLLDVPDFLGTLRNYLKTNYKNINEKRI
jgi:homoserine O-acetyltransferase